MKFSDLQKQITGKFWNDDLSLDRRIIENRFCPHCRRPFAYSGVSNKSEYRAYGVCEPCDFAKLFWTETAARQARKARIAKAASLGII